MLALLLATLSAPEGHEVRKEPAPAAKPCMRTAPQWAKQDAPVAPRQLNREPEADTYLGVLHIEGGCEKPITVNDWRARRAR